MTDDETEDEWRRLRYRLHVRQGGLCLRCSGRFWDVHHRRRRGVHDEHTDCPCNLVGLCRTCHSWAHANPTQAQEAGWIVSTYEPAPSLVPIHTRYASLLLLCDGTERLATVVVEPSTTINAVQ